MSGGVDSSVAAYLLQQQGYACIGVTMRLYENETAGIPRGHTCCSLDDVEDARAVAYDLGMPYYVLNFTEEFDEKVIRKFVQVYQNGGTPNPCIDCNRYLKFDHLLNRARELGCDYIATGHYISAGLSPLTLAYIGDGVFDLVIRSVVVGKGNTRPNQLHHRTSQIVKAHTQAVIIQYLEPMLTEEEAEHVCAEDAMPK